MKTITKLSLILLSPFVYMAAIQANTPYILGQVGAYNDLTGYYSYDNKELGFTGRVAAGYVWDSMITFGKKDDQPKYLCFDYGLELGYQYYERSKNNETRSVGRATYTRNTDYHRQAIDLLGVLNFKTPVNLDFFVKLGPALIIERDQLNTTYSDQMSAYWRQRSSRQYVPKLIVGTGYNITHKINVNLALTHEFETDNVENASTLMAGLKYNFA